MNKLDGGGGVLYDIITSSEWCYVEAISRIIDLLNNRAAVEILDGLNSALFILTLSSFCKKTTFTKQAINLGYENRFLYIRRDKKKTSLQVIQD